MNEYLMRILNLEYTINVMEKELEIMKQEFEYLKSCLDDERIRTCSHSE